MILNNDFYRACCKSAMHQHAKRCPICKTNVPYRAKTKDLRIGDQVRIGDMPYGVATVKKIETHVTVFRPYVHHDNFTYTGGVICYVGFEEFMLTDDSEVIVLRESDIPCVVNSETDEGRIRRAKC